MEDQAPEDPVFPSLSELQNSLPPDNTGGSGDPLAEVEENRNSSGHENSPYELNDSSYDDSSLFVGDIARTLTEEQLKDLFSPFGEVVNAEIKRDKITKTSLGYAFVQYKTRQEAAAAKKHLHKTTVVNRPIRIGWAQKNTNLFVGDLDPSVTSEMLREAFKAYGDIIDDETFAKNQNYGFVKFKRRIDAETAKREMDGRLLGGRRIRTGWGDANTQRHCVHIQFDPSSPLSSPSSLSPTSPPASSSPPEVLSETDLLTAFSPYGTVLNVHLPRTAARLRGFGFVRYNDTDEGEDSAEAAIAALHNTRIAGVLVSCNFGKKQNSKRRSSLASILPSPLVLPQEATLHDNIPVDSPTSPKDAKNQQLSRENAVVNPSTPANSNGNDDNSPKPFSAELHKLSDPKNKSKGRTRQAYHKQSYHQSPVHTQRHDQSPHVSHPIHPHSSPTLLHPHHSPQHSPQFSTHQRTRPPHNRSSHVNSHTSNHTNNYPINHNHAHTPPHTSPHMHSHQVAQTLMDSHIHSVPSHQQPLPHMYHHGPWIATQGWIPYMVPQYYSPGMHTIEGMQDNGDMALHQNSYHMPTDTSTHPPMYMYEYPTPMNPMDPMNPMNPMDHMSHMSHMSPVTPMNHLNLMNPSNSIMAPINPMDPNNSANQPFLHQSYSYAYSSHAT